MKKKKEKQRKKKIKILFFVCFVPDTKIRTTFDSLKFGKIERKKKSYIKSCIVILKRDHWYTRKQVLLPTPADNVPGPLYKLLYRVLSKCKRVKITLSRNDFRDQYLFELNFALSRVNLVYDNSSSMNCHSHKSEELTAFTVSKEWNLTPTKTGP